MIELLTALDTRLMYFCNVTLHNPVFDWYMPLFREGDNWRIPLLIMWVVLMIFGGNRGRWAGLGAVLILALSDPISSHVIKPLVERIRPCNVLGNLWLFRDGAWMMTPEPVIEIYKSSWAFTSSHAANSGGQAIWWSVIYPRTRWLYWTVGFSVGFSRVYVGMHYPFDVLGGWVIGFICFAAVWYPAQKWGPKALRREYSYSKLHHAT